MAIRYQWMPTRHLRMRRRSSSRVPSLPSTILVTTKAASAGPATEAGRKESWTPGAGVGAGARGGGGGGGGWGGGGVVRRGRTPKGDGRGGVGSRTSQPPKK